ncbi:endonuclease/exonuclease/phosphatase family protein [Vibrio sp. CAU 1672]|uniref:endonuclease/exonuclease/phosphatase family protein n=1 Tax=Vibrio sp. CAU 1672 TaxID=3032594 RepID=UPI0023DAF921|nr:endonuclease/exonuclease/phosphatase family protein [Vibrio sp. CAU 1672]MDF2155521.1 endonuclease/exonuclease/phosphatase family protein [Vibrio sp. CAU 1672]
MVKRLTLMVVATIAGVLIGFQLIFSIPEQPQIVSQSGALVRQEVNCLEFDAPQALDHHGELNLLIWNIYKQGRTGWKTALDTLADQSQLLLLQEASLTDELKKWLINGLWVSNRVTAFKAFDHAAGVISIARPEPVRACAYTATEPWLRLPKSALYSEYLLSDGTTLAVFNIHAINFTWGTKEYRAQLATLQQALQSHEGPVVFAGDFNSWSEERLVTMTSVLKLAGLEEVRFNPDYRTQFVTGLALDHVYYRGLKVEYAKAPQSDASDHNPLLVRFRLEQ